MALYRCHNCEYFAGSNAPAECPVCHTKIFDDIEPLDDPQHPENRKIRERMMFAGRLFLPAAGLSICAALILNGTLTLNKPRDVIGAAVFSGVGHTRWVLAVATLTIESDKLLELTFVRPQGIFVTA